MKKGFIVERSANFQFDRLSFFSGLVHISQLKKERVNAVADVVNRGQRVKVKVLKYTGEKISLSMREVDQDTGEDLNPRATDEEMADRYAN